VGLPHARLGPAGLAKLDRLGQALPARADDKAAATVARHLEGILNAVVHRATNAGSESVNARIQKIKKMACGYRNRERFRNAIYFHLGGLELDPAAHTGS